MINKYKIIYGLCIALIINSLFDGIDSIFRTLIVSEYEITMMSIHSVLLSLFPTFLTYVILKIISNYLKKRYSGIESELSFEKLKLIVGAFLFLSGILSLAFGLIGLFSNSFMSKLVLIKTRIIIYNVLSVTLMSAKVLVGLKLMKINREDI